VSESIISLSKDRQTGIHTIAVATARRGNDTTRFTFAYDDVKGTHVSKGAPAEKLAALSDLHARFQARVSTRKFISRSEIEGTLSELDAELTSKSPDAKKKDVDRHVRKMVAANVLRKGGQRGWYEVVSAEGDHDDDGLF
jgi:Fic family protein